MLSQFAFVWSDGNLSLKKLPRKVEVLLEYFWIDVGTSPQFGTVTSAARIPVYDLMVKGLNIVFSLLLNFGGKQKSMRLKFHVGYPFSYFKENSPANSSFSFICLKNVTNIYFSNWPIKFERNTINLPK